MLPVSAGTTEYLLVSVMNLDFDKVYLKLPNNPTFWVVENGIRRPICSMSEVHRIGLRPVTVVSEKFLQSIPTSKDENPDRELPSIQELAGVHEGEVMWVVGSAASIQNLTNTHFKKGPIVAMNYAIQQVEQLFPRSKRPIYSMQKDKCFVEPDRAILLVHSAESRCCFGDYEPQYQFNNREDFGLDWNIPSIVVCMALARLMGCIHVNFLCCDGSAQGDKRAVHDGKITLPKNADLYAIQGEMVLQYSKEIGMPVKWLEVGK